MGLMLRILRSRVPEFDVFTDRTRNSHKAATICCAGHQSALLYKSCWNSRGYHPRWGLTGPWFVPVPRLIGLGFRVLALWASQFFPVGAKHNSPGHWPEIFGATDSRQAPTEPSCFCITTRHHFGELSHANSQEPRKDGSFARLLLVVSVAIPGWLALPNDSSQGGEPLTGLHRMASADSPTDNLTRSNGHQRPLFKFVGAGSCAAANCHGGDGSRGAIGSEYSIWIQQDPHARAYTVLFSDLSQLITAQLRLETPAHQSAMCLNCHAPHSASPQLMDGVTCESCHGPAEKWLKLHVQRDWEDNDRWEKADKGFHYTKDILTRARVCVECHVGSQERDVNHDLIAAGHPRLFFELSAFHANMPKHWPVRDDLARQSPDGKRPNQSYFEAKLWAVGQVASAEAAVELLVSRVSSEEAIWPEFAEHGCFACHHDLTANSWRQERAFPNRRPGSYPWSTWSFPLFTEVGDELISADLKIIQDVSAKLEEEMSKSYPEPTEVKHHAQVLRENLSDCAKVLNSQSYTLQDLSTLLIRFTTDEGKLEPQNWDAATQLYLALVAVHQGFSDLQPSGKTQTHAKHAIDASLENIRKQLEFRQGFNSPKEFSPDAIRHELYRIQQLLKSDWCKAHAQQ